MKYTHLLWDFNGTIFNDVGAGINAVNKMLVERELSPIPSVERYREIFDFPIEDYYKGLGFDFDREPYEVLAPIWVELYDANAQSSGLSEGVAETMRAIDKLGVEQVVLSACEIGMLNSYLERLGVRGYLNEVIGLDNIHARSKIAEGLAWRERNLEAKALMIGDTTHDFETARSLGADCVLFAGGHQSRAKLEACGCPVVDKIEEIILML